MEISSEQFDKLIDLLSINAKEFNKLSGQMDAIIENSIKKQNPGLSNSRLTTPEKKRYDEIAKIFTKEFKAMYEDMEDNSDIGGTKKLEGLFSKDIIRVRIESISKSVIKDLHTIIGQDKTSKLVENKQNGVMGGLGALFGAGLGGIISGAGPWGAILGLIAMVGGVGLIYLLIKNLDSISKFITAVLPVVTNFFVKTIPVIMKSVGDFIVRTFPAIAKFIQNIIPTLVKGISDLVTVVAKDLFPFFTKLLDTGVKLVETVFNKLPSIIKVVAESLKPLLVDLYGFFKFIIASVPVIIEQFLTGMKDLISVILDKLPKLLPFVIQFTTLVKDVINNLIDHLPVILNILKDALIPVVNDLKDLFIALFPVVQNVINTLITGIETIAPYIRDILITAFNDLKGIISDLVPLVMSLGNNIKDILVTAFDDLASIITTVWNTAKTFFGYLDDIATKTLTTVEHLFDNFNTQLKWIVELEPSKVIKLAGAITLLGSSIALFGLQDSSGNLVANAGSFFTHLIGGKTPFDMIIDVANHSDKIDKVTGFINSLSDSMAKLSTTKYGDNFATEMGKFKKGVEMLTSIKDIKNLDKITAFNNSLGNSNQSNVFTDLYKSTSDLNKSIMKLDTSLKEISDKLQVSVNNQQEQTKLAVKTEAHLQDIKNKDSAGNNVVVSQPTSYIFNDSGVKNSDFRLRALDERYT